MSRKKVVKEIVDIENVKKEEKEGVEKDLAIFEESKIQMEKDLVNFAEFGIPTEKVLGTSVEKSEKVSIKKVKKLKCDFKTFKTERDKAKMRVPDKCEICGKSFKENDDMYVAWDKEMKEIFICKGCAEKE